MRTLKEGIALDGITLIKGGDKEAINMMVLNDDGTARDLTGDTIDVEVHPRTGRIATPLLSLSGTLVVAEAGTFTITPTDTETDTLDVGNYKYWVKHTESGGNIFYDGPGDLTVI